MRTLADRINTLTLGDGIVWGLILGAIVGVVRGDIEMWIVIGITLGIALAAHSERAPRGVDES
jgi:mannose/fructose/N-acetylgalactosamine-specific phosphotransferase system component IIC